jgi:hypothetical protein
MTNITVHTTIQQGEEKEKWEGEKQQQQQYLSNTQQQNHQLYNMCGSDGIIVFSNPLMSSKKFQTENGVMWQNFRNSKSFWMIYLMFC